MKWTKRQKILKKCILIFSQLRIKIQNNYNIGELVFLKFNLLVWKYPFYIIATQKKIRWFQRSVIKMYFQSNNQLLFACFIFNSNCQCHFNLKSFSQLFIFVYFSSLSSFKKNCGNRCGFFFILLFPLFTG